MLLEGVLQKFVEQSPITVMSRLALQEALDPAWLDALFEEHSKTQYKRELLFSMTVEIMSLVVVGQRPSIHAVAKAMGESLPVSPVALYEKINRTEPELVRALVSGSAQRLQGVLQPLLQEPASIVPGWKVRILDGNHLAASEKRIKPLREFRGAALPGQSLVVYDPDLDMIVDLLPCEDAHAQERTLMGPILQSAGPGELWIADRQFSTRTILAGWHEQGSCFIVREHGSNPSPAALDELQEAGVTDTGRVFEQAVSIPGPDGQPLRLRRIELRLYQRSEDGDEVIRFLTNAPADEFPATRIATLYRRRWRIEAMFQRLESVLNSEITTLGKPRAALLAFGVAALAYNVLAVLAAAVRCKHQLDETKIKLSSYYLASEIKAHYAGMMIALPADSWMQFDRMTPAETSQLLLQIAGYVDPRKFRTHTRAPKPRIKKGYAPPSEAKRHVSTARVMKLGRVE